MQTNSKTVAHRAAISQVLLCCCYLFQTEDSLGLKHTL